jgi:demethylmenaquinone methyltransferase/2-methoxy-6-polyprenyl-1,4-benzoquinol methylase
MEAPEARDIFDQNATTYDRVNTVLSLGLDGRWRRWVAGEATWKPDARVLDAFSGTGLVGLAAASMGGKVTLADISPHMLSIAGKRAEKRDLIVDIKLVDLTKEPSLFKRESFDSITIVFGIRYLKNPVEVLERLSFLLRPGGRLVALEFIVPSGGPISRLAAIYFFSILPTIGAFLAKQRRLYDYLVSSTKVLGGKNNLLKIVSSAGFKVSKTKHFGFGLVCGVVASRSARPL